MTPGGALEDRTASCLFQHRRGRTPLGVAAVRRPRSRRLGVSGECARPRLVLQLHWLRLWQQLPVPSPSSFPLLAVLFFMDVLSFEQRSVVEWDETDVHQWLSKLGFPQYEHQILGGFLRFLEQLSPRLTLPSRTSYLWRCAL